MARAESSPPCGGDGTERNFFRRRHGVIAPLVKRIASENPLERKPAALCGAVLLQRLHSVLGAGGDIVAAPGTAGGDAALIKPHQPNQNPLHGMSPKRPSFRLRRRKLSFSSFQEAVSVLLRATRIRSQPWERRGLESR